MTRNNTKTSIWFNLCFFDLNTLLKSSKGLEYPKNNNKILEIKKITHKRCLGS
jgi:hypothetical protein